MVMDKYILDAQGHPVLCDDVFVWDLWLYVNDDARRVGLDERDDVRVSTVFLGLDHAFVSGPPVLWETMVFGGEHDGYQERYTSRESAEHGHAKAVRMVWP
jgi:hypothetical protein